MKRNSLTILALATALSVSLWGCGSNRDEGDTQVQGPDAVPQAQLVGIANCAQCHKDLNAAWLAGPHGNADGNPDIVIGSSADCARCHNASGDGQSLLQAYGVANRAVVSCETCHGGGQYHFGLGPMPRPTPGVGVCASCHDNSAPHPTSNAAGEYALGKHAKGEAVAARTSLYARCSMCHSDEGFRQYAQAHARQGGHDYIEQAFANEPNRETWTPVQCTTCHNVHSGDLTVQATTGFSQEFNLCTSCHMVFVGADGRLDQGAYGTSEESLEVGRLEYHHPLANKYGSYTALIADTHFAGLFPKAKQNPDGSFVKDANGENVYDTHELIAGYGINVAAADSCTRCHNPHSTEFRQ